MKTVSQAYFCPVTDNPKFEDVSSNWSQIISLDFSSMCFIVNTDFHKVESFFMQDYNTPSNSLFSMATSSIPNASG